MTSLVQDLRYAIRMLLKNPGFAVVAVIALALGMGANTVIFSVVNTVLLRSLPYDDPDRLMIVKENKLPQFPEFSVSPGNFLDWQKQSNSFEKLAAIINGAAYNLAAGDAEPERLRGARVSAGLFEMLGAKPVQGRTFLDEEDQPGRENVVILSGSLWKRRFGSDPNIIGQSITLSAASYTVIGIMPSTFQFPDRDTELWTPIAFTARQAQQHGSHYISVIGRLKRDVTVQQADVELKSIAARLAEQYPGSNAGWSTNVFPMQEYEVRDIKSGLIFLLGAVALVLLIACANVANLLLARSTARQKEMAIRSALGASRWRVVRQLLTESLLLALLGGGVDARRLLGWSLACARARRLAADKRCRTSITVLGLTLVVTLMTGVIFGLAPALQASSPNLNETLKEAGRGTTARRHRVRNSLVIVEVALALMLLVCSGLMIRSFIRLQRVNPGFNQSNGLTVNIALPGRKNPNSDQHLAFFTQLIERTSALPGVVAAGRVNRFRSDDFLVGFNILAVRRFRPVKARAPTTTRNAGLFHGNGIPCRGDACLRAGQRQARLRS
jgi:putative ABC transport system permease protein